MLRHTFRLFMGYSAIRMGLGANVRMGAISLADGILCMESAALQRYHGNPQFRGVFPQVSMMRMLEWNGPTNIIVRLAHLCVALVLLLLGTTSAFAGELVNTSKGKLRGTVVDGVHSFKGIPFAAPPLDARRWVGPQPASAWSGELAADAYRPACQQAPYPSGSIYSQDLPAKSEDCLYLNVWSADLFPVEKAPVMVWIHGGSFTRGAGSVPTYDGAKLAQKGVVLVTINYRLNIFGFLSHPQLTAEQGGSSGNYGLLDQISALRWVNDNIALFGGDPERVTIFGESAGSSAVNYLLSSPLAAGLFSQAIGQSGGSLSPQEELIDGHAVGEELFTAAGVENIAALRALPTEKVQSLFSDFEAQGKRIRPLVDGRVVPEQTLALFKRGAYNKVPSLVGYNKDESTAFALYPSIPFLFKTQDKFEEGLKDYFGIAAYPFIWAYPEQSGSQQPYLDFWRDLIFGWNMHTWARLNEAAGESSWLYFFSHVPGNEAGEQLGAFHAAEIPYVFGNNVPQSSSDQRVHELVQNFWVNFAKTGDPNGEGLPVWPRYGSNEAYLELNDKPTADESLDWKQMKLWGMAFDR